MAPATIAGAAPKARGGREATWTRAKIIEAIREWVALHGEPPRAADWNPSSAKWSGASWRIERYRRGRADGSPWPSLNAAKAPFGGSLTAAIVAAGFEPAKPGPKRRRDVAPERADALEMHPDVRVALQAARAEAKAAAEQIAIRDRRLEHARTRAARAEAELAAARAAAARPRSAIKLKTKVVRERVVDDAVLRRAREQAAADRAAARDEIALLSTQLAEARRDATRLAAKLERAEADKTTLRADKRELGGERDRNADRLAAAQRMLLAAREETERVRGERLVVREQAPEQAVLDTARAQAAAALWAAEDAELRAAKAQREYLELAAAVRGEPRKLSRAELAALQAAGPSGPAVLASALKALAKARATGNPTALQAALLALASAAVSWKERL